MHRNIPEERAHVKEMIPQYRSSYFELYYTEDASMYLASKDQEDEEVSGGGDRGRFRMRFAAPDRDIYKSIAENKMVDSREFMTKKFLIKGKTDEFQWKVADGQMMKILDMLCMKAEYKDTANTYVAWFTPQIPIANGPAEFGGLPGMILMLDVNDGERVYTATEIQAVEVDRAVLKEPTKGKEVTSEEFREIMHEKMKEMRGQRGGPNVIIHRG